MILSIIAVSIGAILFLFWLIYSDAARIDGVSLPYLPTMNASFNLISAIFLCLGVVAVKQKKIEKHKRFLSLAFLFSTLFLIGYIIHHSINSDSIFLTQGIIRKVYFFILISHILLTILGLPLILITFYLSLSNRITLHKAIAKYTFPIWLYISVSGILTYLFLTFLNQ